MNVTGSYQPIKTGQSAKRWVGRDWLSAARALQRRGLTFTEIAEKLDVARDAVVQALYTEVVK